MKRLRWIRLLRRQRGHKEHHDLDLGCNKQEGDSYDPVRGKWYELPFLLEL